MSNLPPVDSRNVIEVAPGIFIPANRADEFEMAMDTHPAVAQAVFEMHEATTEVAPGIFVQRQDVEVWIERMSDPVFMAAMDCLMDRLNSDAHVDVRIQLHLTPFAKAMLDRQPCTVQSFALAFGKSH